MKIIDMEIARLSERVAVNRHHHKPVGDLQYLATRLRLEQLKSEIRDDLLELARKEFARRYHEEHGFDHATCGHRSQCVTSWTKT